MSEFDDEVKERIDTMSRADTLQNISNEFMRESIASKYSYNFSWLGRPIIQYPQDMVVMQELIWKVKPDLIIETGIAHGGSLILSASILAMLDMNDAIEKNSTITPSISNRKVLGIDIDIREHNRIAIEQHPMASRIQMLQGSSIAEDVIKQVKDIAKNYKRILVCLDSNHTHDHVLAELDAYAPLVSKGSYCVVFDTNIEDLPDNFFPNRPWSVGNNPKTAVWEYLRLLDDEGRVTGDGQQIQFKSEKLIENKLLLTVAPEGYLKRH